MSNPPTYEYKIIKENLNPPLERREVSFVIIHHGASTPKRGEVREKLAARMNADPSMISISKMETKTNSWETVGLAHVYLSQARAKLLVPTYLPAREVHKTKPKEHEEKAAAAKPTAKKEPTEVKKEAAKPPSK